MTTWIVGLEEANKVGNVEHESGKSGRIGSQVGIRCRQHTKHEQGTDDDKQRRSKVTMKKCFVTCSSIRRNNKLLPVEVDEEEDEFLLFLLLLVDHGGCS